MFPDLQSRYSRCAIVEGLAEQVSSLTEQVAMLTEQVSKLTTQVSIITDTLEIMKSDLVIIKGGLKKKVDYDDFIAPEKRVASVESKIRR